MNGLSKQNEVDARVWSEPEGLSTNMAILLSRILAG